MSGDAARGKETRTGNYVLDKAHASDSLAERDRPEISEAMTRAGAFALDASRGSLTDDETAEAVYIAMERMRLPPKRGGSV